MTDQTTNPIDVEEAAQALREVQDICPGCARAADLLEQLHKSNQELGQLVQQTNQAALYFLNLGDQLDALWVNHVALLTKPERTTEEAEQLAGTLYQIHNLSLIRQAARQAPKA
jgi:hypothetical protein